MKIPIVIYYKPLYDFIVKIGHKMVFIEYDGEQHFTEIKGKFHKKPDSFYKRKIKDLLKTYYVIKNNGYLLRISYKEFNNIENILEDFLNKVKKINKPISYCSDEQLYSEHLNIINKKREVYYTGTIFISVFL